MSALITIVIPTYKRPDSLERLLLSIFEDIGQRQDIAIVVADNDVTESARKTVEHLSKDHNQRVIYTVEPNPGVSNARNAGMAHVTSRYVLFLDDDMEVVPPYLDMALHASQQLGSALTFLPAIAALPEGSENLSRWLTPLFSRMMSGETRLIDETFGTGGCFVDLEGLRLPDPVFDPAMNS
ncbi:MAG: glycosyltransferase family A protein [Pseudomonadota bacterium]